MASKAQQVERYIKIINQQIEILTGEKQSVIETLDLSINQVLSEVNAWLNGGNVNPTTYAEMSNRIQQVINFFMAKSAEISDLEIEDNKIDSDLLQTAAASSNNSTIPKTNKTRDQVQQKIMLCRVETVHTSGDPVCADNSYITSTRFAILEEAVFSLKKTTEQLQEQQENVNKKMKILTNAKLKCKKKIQERLKVLEKSSEEISSNFNDTFKTVKNVDAKLNRLDNENKSVNVSLNELNKQISSVRTCSNDVIMSIQDLSKSVESTNQHYNEMSHKMNQLEISMNLMSTKYTEHFENMSTINKEKVDETIGLACHMLAKRLAPLDKLNEILNKKAESRTRLSQEGTAENQVAQLNEKISQLELKCNFPNVGFYASTTVFDKNYECTDVSNFNDVGANYGNHFDPVTGKFTAPLNGLYLISMSASQYGIHETYYTQCSLRRNYSLSPAPDAIMVFGATGNQSVTRCSEMSAGDVIYLQAGSVEENIKNEIVFHFSCVMIKGFML